MENTKYPNQVKTIQVIVKMGGTPWLLLQTEDNHYFKHEKGETTLLDKQQAEELLEKYQSAFAAHGQRLGWLNMNW